MKDKKGTLDWLLLVSLILITNQAVFSIKILGVVLIYIARFNFDFGFFRGRLPKFYPYIILLSIFTFLFITRDYSINYIIAFIVGNAFWVASLLVSHQVKLSVERYEFSGVYKTIKVFTLFHFAACIYQLIRMMEITGTSNPYDPYLPFPYGMSAGDNLFGIFMENSYYSIMVSSMLAVFFLFQKNIVFTLLSTLCLIMIFGNLGTMIFSAVLVSLLGLGLLFSSLGESKWVRRILLPQRYHLFIPVLFAFILVLYITVSPQNYTYIVEKAKAKIFRIKQDNGNSYATLIENQELSPKAFETYATEQTQEPITAEQANAYGVDFAGKGDSKLEVTKTYIRNLQGKNLSVFETIALLKSGITPFLFGAGTARFSSAAAFKVSGLDSSRLFISMPHYKSDLYAENHHQLIIVRETIGDDALKSTANWPDSTYNQLLGEYGMIGAFLFLFFYLGYFIKEYRKLTYGFWLILLLLPFLHLNYTFETLCLIPFFELLIFADIRRNESKILSE